MVYPQTIEHKIGFDTVRQQVNELCTSQHGRKMCELMEFSGNRDEVVARLEETAEMVRIIEGEFDFPIGNIHDMDHVIGAMRVEGTHVSAQELLRLRASMETMSEIASFFKSARDDEGKSTYPRLDTVALTLITFPSLVSENQSRHRPLGQRQRQRFAGSRRDTPLAIGHERIDQLADA